MKGISIRAVALAFLASLGLDVISAMILTTIYGGPAFTADMTEEQRVLVIDALASNRPFLLWSLVLGTLTTILAGYLAARIARVVPYWNAFAVGAVGIVMNALLGTELPLWFNVISFASLLPAALVGGHIAKRQMEEQQQRGA